MSSLMLFCHLMGNSSAANVAKIHHSITTITFDAHSKNMIDKLLECTLRRPLLDKLLPELVQTTYKDYMNDISTVLEVLHTFRKKLSS